MVLQPASTDSRLPMFFKIGVPKGFPSLSTARHLAVMFSRCLKDSFFANLTSV